MNTYLHNIHRLSIYLNTTFTFLISFNIIGLLYNKYIGWVLFERYYNTKIYRRQFYNMHHLLISSSKNMNVWHWTVSNFINWKYRFWVCEWYYHCVYSILMKSQLQSTEFHHISVCLCRNMIQCNCSSFLFVCAEVNVLFDCSLWLCWKFLTACFYIDVQDHWVILHLLLIL